MCQKGNLEVGWWRHNIFPKYQKRMLPDNLFEGLNVFWAGGIHFSRGGRGPSHCKTITFCLYCFIKWDFSPPPPPFHDSKDEESVLQACGESREITAWLGLQTRVSLQLLSPMAAFGRSFVKDGEGLIWHYKCLISVKSFLRICHFKNISFFG